VEKVQYENFLTLNDGRLSIGRMGKALASYPALESTRQKEKSILPGSRVTQTSVLLIWPSGALGCPFMKSSKARRSIYHRSLQKHQFAWTTVDLYIRFTGPVLLLPGQKESRQDAQCNASALDLEHHTIRRSVWRSVQFRKWDLRLSNQLTTKNQSI